MRTLPTEFREDGFTFHQIAREGDVALFRKSNSYARKNSSWLLERYEVVMVQKTPDHTWPNGKTTSAHEHMPKSNQWGTHGWTLQTLDQAWDKFNEIKGLINEQSSRTA